jgi:DNA-binding transcriptional ArsR family regulator
MSVQTTEQIAHPTREQLDLSAVLHALSDPVRLTIVAELARGGHEYTCGSFELPVTKSTCTHHFKVLREAGVIKQRHKGTTRLNTLRREDLDARFPRLLDTILSAAGDSALEAGAAGDSVLACGVAGDPAPEPGVAGESAPEPDAAEPTPAAPLS